MPRKISFDSIPPKNDEKLLSLLYGNADADPRLSLRFEREPTMMRELARVLAFCGDDAIPVEMYATELSMLKGFEQEPMMDMDQETTMLGELRRVSTANYGLKFQPLCFTQMQQFCRFLQAHRTVKSLKLSMHEYETDKFMEEIKALHPPLLPPMPPMLCMDRPTEDEKARLLGQMYASAVTQGQLQISNGVNRLEMLTEAALEQFHDTSGTTTALVSRASELTPGRRYEAALSLLHADATRPGELKYMSEEEYAEVMEVFCNQPLPDSVQTLQIVARLNGPSVSGRFLDGLGGLVNLTLAYCKIDDAAFAILGHVIGQRLPRLETLVLARNQLKDADLGAVVGPSLVSVDFTYNPITSNAANFLFAGIGGNSTLSTIDLSYTDLVGRELRFGLLATWEAPGAQLILPTCFADEEEKRAVTAFLPKNITVVWVDNGSACEARQLIHDLQPMLCQ